MVPVFSLALRVSVVVMVLASLSVPREIFAQTIGSIDGRVLYRSTGEGVPGVQVSASGTRVGTVTAQDGRFRLSGVSVGDQELRFYLLGCPLTTQTVSVRSGEEIRREVLVGPPTLEVRGLVIEGLARDVPERDLPFAVGQVDVGDPTSPRSLADLIRGRVPGVRVVQGSGEPGSGASVQLRGPTSIQGKQDALIVVDGIPAGTRLGDIDPSDVEHVAVLKGPVAAAVYGSRGQAGVLEITTKRGVMQAGSPLLLVDGEIVEGSLADIPSESIAQIEFVGHNQARLVLGSLGRDGAIRVTTMDAANRLSEHSTPFYCRGPER